MSESPTSQQLAGLLADANRRSVVAALVLADAPLDSRALVEATGLTARAVADSTSRLVAGGLLVISDGDYSLVAEVFQHAARVEAPQGPPSAHDDQPDDIARVLDVAFTNGRLAQWPGKHSRRLIVLDYLAQQFEIGKRYSEPQVNDLLRAFDDDVAAMRRYLVDEQFLDRSNGEYWRCGGSV